MKSVPFLLLALGLTACAGSVGAPPLKNTNAGAGRTVHRFFNGTSDIVQSAVAHTHSTSTTCTFTNAPTVGNVLVFGVGLYPASSTTTAPTGVTTIDAAANSQMRTYYRVVQPGDASTWTFTASASSYLTVGCYEIAGANTSSPIDAHRAQNFAKQTTISTPSVTPVTSGDLPLAFFGDAQTGSFSNLTTGWMNDINQNAAAFDMYAAHGPIAGTGAVQASVTLGAAGYGGTALVLLAPASQATSTPPPTPSPTPGGGGSTTPQFVQNASGDRFAASSITVVFSAVPASGHVLMAFFHNNGTTTGDPNTYTPPAGWTQLDVDTAHAFQSYSVFYHVTGAGENNNYVFTPSCVCRETTWFAADYANVNTSSPFDGHGFTFVNNGTSWTTPSQTPTQSGDLAVVAMMPSQSSQTWANTAGWTLDLGPTNIWSQELLHRTQPDTSPVTETSTFSTAGIGYAGVVLLAPGGVPKVDWDTWGMKPTRNNYNPVETTLTTSNVGGLHQHWATNVSGIITGAPVVAANVTGTSQGTADMLYIGDNNANFYAMNAQTGSIVWQRTLQTQFIDGNAQGTKGCFDQPSGIYGIGASATIDRSRNLVYVVDALGNLYGLDLATGTQKTGPVVMWPYQNGINITNNYGGLNEDATAGLIYVPGGAHCGLPEYGGVETYNINTGAVSNWFVEGGPPEAAGGVWGPGGAVIDPRSVSNPAMNDIYFGTGAASVGTNRYPYSIVRLTSSLGIVAANNPFITAANCCPDLDFGATPLVFTPTSGGCGATLVGDESKNGTFYLYNADAINNGPIQSIQLGTSSQAGFNLGTAAYDPTKNLVFINSGSDSSDTTTGLLHGVLAFTVTAACTLQLVWQDTVGPNKLPAGPPEPPTIANGVLYYVDGPGAGSCSPVAHPCPMPSVADFYAFDETTGNTLFHTTLPFGLFTPPVVVNGTVYLSTWNGQGPGIVYAFGL